MDVFCCGYGRAAERFALALRAANANVAYRQLRGSTPGSLRDLTRVKFSGKSDAILQFLPPSEQQFFGSCGVNLGVTSEKGHSVIPQLTPLDIGLPCDTNVFSKQWPAPPAVTAFKQGRFLFYTIGSFQKRHMLAAVLRAYFAEFYPWEPVGLVIKTDPESVKGIETIRQAVRIQTPQIFLLDQVLSDQNLYGLHQACDCFVHPTLVPGWGSSEIDAVGFGKPTLLSRGPLATWTVPTHKEPAFGDDVLTGREVWHTPDLQVLRKQLREAFEDRVPSEHLKMGCQAQDMSRFSYGRVGARLLEVIDEQARCRGNGLGRSGS